MITQSRLRELIHYDPEVGSFVWKPRLNNKPFNVRCAGRPAGYVDDKGYRRIEVDGKEYRAHKLAWLYVYGEWPDLVDHRDLDKTNNVIHNLRLATPAENARNAPRPSHNTSGAKGVHWCAYTQRWEGNIKVNGRRYRVGRFRTFEEAAEAVRAKRVELHGEFAQH